MAGSASSPWATGAWQPFATPDRRILLLSIAVQLPLALLLGHSYDMRIFMATGYLVGTGHDPYVARNLSAVFPHVGFSVIASVDVIGCWPGIVMCHVCVPGAGAQRLPSLVTAPVHCVSAW